MPELAVEIPDISPPLRDFAFERLLKGAQTLGFIQILRSKGYMPDYEDCAAVFQSAKR